MKQTTINRICTYTDNHKLTKIGQYFYKADFNRGYISRCHVHKIGRVWLDKNGNLFDGWEVVAEFTDWKYLSL